MARINAHYQKLQAGYLFPEIKKRVNDFLSIHPDTTVISLGIGNTTQPLPPSIIKGLQKGVAQLADAATYTGYGDEQGNAELRKKLSEWYTQQEVEIDPLEIFVNDGAKCDSANITSIFSADSVVAVQDPVYPVYVDSNVIAGKTGRYDNGYYKKLIYMVCNEKNGFFPDIPKEKADIIFLCSPNNPTGAVATKQQLKKFVDYALQHKAIIVFDAAYSSFITDPTLPRSIYEIEGAKACAIEISSFSKWAGFTGVRLGWTIVPFTLTAEHTGTRVINGLWNRRQTTMFNGASNISQEGGLAVLSQEGQTECKKIIAYYMKNAKHMRQTFERLGLRVFGGENAPYIWIKTPRGMTSWEFFDTLLNQAHVVCTPGSGFGPHGEGYVRLSAFGHAEDIQKALIQIEKNIHI